MRLTREQVHQIDRIAVERYHIPSIVLMENAARGAAAVAEQMLADRAGGEILVVCGGGNNGGDGLAIARHLHLAGHRVRVALTVDAARYQGDALVNWRIVSAMKIAVAEATPSLLAERNRPLIVDAMFGTGLTSAPREPFEQQVAAMELAQSPILCVDVPSGLDADTGRPFSVAVHGTATVTFAAEKAGFATPEAAAYLGKLSVARIGCPLDWGAG